MVHTLANGEKICCIYVGLCDLSQGVSSNTLCSFILTSFVLRITLIRNEGECRPNNSGRGMY